MCMHNNHCHRVTAHLQLNFIIIIIIIIIILLLPLWAFVACFRVNFILPKMQHFISV